MTIVSRCLVVALFATPLGGCIGVSSDLPYPVTDNGPNPAPLPGYRVVCQTGPAPLEAVFHTYSTGCRQEFTPAVSSEAIRVRG